MPLEDEIIGLRADIRTLTAAILGGKAAAPGVADKPGKENKEPAKPKHTAEEVTSMCVRVKNEIDADTAKKLIKDFGKADALAKVQPASFDALYAAAEATLAQAAEAAAKDDL